VVEEEGEEEGAEIKVTLAALLCRMPACMLRRTLLRRWVVPLNPSPAGSGALRAFSFNMMPATPSSSQMIM
jgi:hypothetical protein